MADYFNAPDIAAKRALFIGLIDVDRQRGVATHEIVIAGGTVTKRFTSWVRAEHEREWTVLSRLHEHVPGLGPVPLTADLDACPPSVTMSAVPGTPLSGKLTGAQFDALEVALRQLWSVPAGGLPLRRYRPREVVALVRRDFTAWPARSGVVGEAVATVAAYLAGSEVADRHDTVLGHSDPNLANYLWDGARVRVVDFEDAGRSDPVYELATLVEHLSARETDCTGSLSGSPSTPPNCWPGGASTRCCGCTRCC